jgi:hypothetical protein
MLLWTQVASNIYLIVWQWCLLQREAKLERESIKSSHGIQLIIAHMVAWAYMTAQSFSPIKTQVSDNWDPDCSCHTFWLSWNESILTDGCILQCPRIKCSTDLTYFLNTRILREWLYCVSLSLLWPFKARNEHSFHWFPDKKRVPLLLIPTISH